jgi:D-threo-aldose 1-dehydrogenase
VIPGGQTLVEMESNLAASRAEIPATLWAAMKAEGLIHPDAPV